MRYDVVRYVVGQTLRIISVPFLLAMLGNLAFALNDPDFESYPVAAFAAPGAIALIAGTMIGAVLLMKILGFALSILIFATVAAIIGGFRGWRLIAISVLATAAMVLVFRVGFKIWFPRPELFKLIDLPIWLQGIL